MRTLFHRTDFVDNEIHEWHTRGGYLALCGVLITYLLTFVPSAAFDAAALLTVLHFAANLVSYLLYLGELAQKQRVSEHQGTFADGAKRLLREYRFRKKSLYGIYIIEDDMPLLLSFEPEDPSLGTDFLILARSKKEAIALCRDQQLENTGKVCLLSEKQALGAMESSGLDGIALWNADHDKQYLLLPMYMKEEDPSDV